MRVHCWVLIRPGARGVPEAFFIEPTSGSALSTQDPNYLGVEFVFNSRNVWVNMQSCRDGLKDMDYNLQDSARWEYVVCAPHASLSSNVCSLPHSWTWPPLIPAHVHL
eukprot:TRINITY_DN9278_c0_g1_i14.p5 TRINITY_DN9278_c0_g1~~TRINITY_DN9278_c0_g1_i14.p5  ORF type:complete len:108 (+),score=12.25 TRINITY_DN9278_c0_g1_i14:267-590(+)